MPKFSLFFLAALVFSLLQPACSQTPRPIALGVYFWQNNQLAPADSSAIRALQKRAGRLPAVFSIYQSWTGNYARFPWREARGTQKLGKTLHICWEPWNGRNDGTWSHAAILSGAHDAYIRAYARDARRFGGPILLRFAHEMNGNWYPWSVAYESSFRRLNGNSPATYVAMWRHVVRIFRQQGANNVRWVWAPNSFFINNFNGAYDQESDLKELYPGDAWVDWLGLSVFNDGARRPWRTFPAISDAAYLCITKISSKPLMIAEMGATEEGAPPLASKSAWLKQTLMVDIPLHYPRVRLVNWFCRDKTREGESNYRFDSSPESLREFRLAVNSPLYGGAWPAPAATRLARR